MTQYFHMSPEPLDPTKYHVLSSSQKRNFVLISILVLVLVLPLIAGGYYKIALHRPAQNDRDITFEIKSGQGVSEIATNLYEAKLINSETLFKIYIYANSLDTSVQAGVYEIPAGTSLVKLVGMLQNGRNDLTITFPEGLRVEEYAERLAAKYDNVDYDKFVDLAKNDEGYLFPDTYKLPSNIQEAAILDHLLDNFRNKTRDILTPEALKKADLTKDQVIIFASILEREVSDGDDREIAAGILINRWKRGELIGADATTQYAVSKGQRGNWWPKELTQYDLDNPSPYNTRKNVGLPPQPICNPGLDAIKSVLNYKTTDYNYYLSDNDGVTRYARTLEEHNANINKYLNL